MLIGQTARRMEGVWADESELFGHEKGSFAGAIAQKKGKLELAAGGTFFLDELGSLGGFPQAMLLRVLQTRELQRLRGSHTFYAPVALGYGYHDALREAKRNIVLSAMQGRAPRQHPAIPGRSSAPAFRSEFLPDCQHRAPSNALSLSPESPDYVGPPGQQDIEGDFRRRTVGSSGEDRVHIHVDAIV